MSVTIAGMANAARRWSLSDRLFGLSLWLALLGPLGRGNHASDDLWGKLSIPAVWFATGSFPYADRFSYTAWGAPWTDHEWLSGVLFYGALALGGDAGLSVLKAAMIGLMIAGALWTARLQRLSVLWPTGLLLLGLPVLYTGLAATGRPQLFTFCLFPALLAFLEHVRLSGRHRRLLLVPLLGVFWANAHGGFIAGLAMVFCYALGEALRGKAWKPYLLSALGWAAATAANPYGFGYWRYLAFALTLPRPGITEWNAVVLAGTRDWELKLSILSAAGAILLALQRGLSGRRAWRELPWPQILALLASFYQAFRAVKLAPLGVLSTACCVPALLVWALPKLREDPLDKTPSALPALGLAAAALWALGCWYDMKPRLQPWVVQVKNADVPVEAVRFLQDSGGCGNLWTPFEAGEFAFWRLYPRFRVSMDGRMECVYPMDVFHRHERTTFDARIEDPALEQADWALIDRRNDFLYSTLRASSRWRLAYQDETYAVLRHEASQPGAPAQKALNARVWSPTKAVFQPEADRTRFSGYFQEASEESARAAACRPSPPT